MKGSRAQNNKQNKQMVGHRPKPDIRDDMDSRKNEEQDTKGGDVTHNKKDLLKREHLKNKREDK